MAALLEPYNECDIPYSFMFIASYMYAGAEPGFKHWGAKLRKKTFGGAKTKKIKKIRGKILIFFFFFQIFFFWGNSLAWAPQAKE
jgi:hypothetical protein